MRSSWTARRMRLAVAGLAALVVAAWAAPAQALEQYYCPAERTFALQSYETGKYVSVEKSWTGDRRAMLRVRADKPGPWEKFQCITLGQHTSLRSLTVNRWVSAEFGWSGTSRGILRARATGIDSWERFYMDRVHGNLVTLRSASNGWPYVSAEFGWSGTRNGLMRARADAYDRWELFWVDWL